MVLLVASPTVAAQLADGLAQGPQLRVVRVSLKTPLIGKAKHLVVHTSGVSQAQHVDTPVYQLLRDPVHGHVALCTYQHLTLAHQRLAYGLNECRRLARPWGSVHHSDVLGAQHLIDGLLLRGVQIGKVQGLEGQRLGLHAVALDTVLGRVPGGIEQVAQIGQTPLGTYGAVECLHHQPVAGLVERQLYAQPLGSLQVDKGCRVRHGHHHTVTDDVAYHARKTEVPDACRAHVVFVVEREERHWPAELKDMLHVGVGSTYHLHRQLVQRVIVAALETQGPPRLPAFHLPAYADALGLLPVGSLLGLVLQLQQQSLLLKCLNGRQHAPHQTLGFSLFLRTKIQIKIICSKHFANNLLES